MAKIKAKRVETIVARPFKASRPKSLAGSWAKKGRVIGDIVNKDTADLWDVVRKR
ncbi:MAG TPA: hypothetical protein VGL53_08050 [Bryobacteraceae bacterium]|jgi:hypothetical protein